MVEPPMPPGPVEPGNDNNDEDNDRREEAAVAPGDPVPEEEDPRTA